MFTGLNANVCTRVFVFNEQNIKSCWLQRRHAIHAEVNLRGTRTDESVGGVKTNLTLSSLLSSHRLQSENMTLDLDLKTSPDLL